MAETTTHRGRHINTTSELTIDILLYHIVPRLPAKSVIRLTTVSKEFHSFLNTQKFAKIHLRHVTTDHRQIHRKLLLLSITKPYNFTTINCETPASDDDDGLTPPNRPLPFLAHDCNLEFISILTSFHGLVCVGIGGPRCSDLILWNPVTGDFKILCKPNFDISHINTRLIAFGLYYSDHDNDYKLIHVRIHGDVYMYSLKSDSWRKLMDFSKGTVRQNWTPHRAWLNENLYFLKQSPYSIMRFDTKTEKFTEITLPFVVLPPEFSAEYLCGRLVVDKGCIHIFVSYDGYDGRKGRNVKHEMWRMNGDGDWSSVDTYKVPMVQWLNRGLQLTKNGNWLMIHSTKDQTSHNLYVLDPEKKAYNHLGIIPEEGRYAETLVSPNHI